jgi:hypothetical protein
MSKSKWFKNKETGEVVYREGYTPSGAVVVRSWDRTLKWVGPVDFRNWYTPTSTSGFPPVKPKAEFKPRYATYPHWSCNEAFVKEYEPGKFKVVLKDGSEVENIGAASSFAKFFEDGSWTVVSEEEALARLDKPKFNPYSKYYEKVGFFVPGGYTDKRFAYYEYIDTVEVGYLFAGYRTVEFVENLFRLGVLTTEPQRKPVEVAKPAEPVKPKFKYGTVYRDVVRGYFYEPCVWGIGYYQSRSYFVSNDDMATLVASGKLITNEEFQKAARAAINGPALSVAGKASEVFDAPAKMLKPKKLLVEWMVPQEGVLYGRSWVSRFFPEGISPATLYTFGSPFKTGRTVEVPQ